MTLLRPVRTGVWLLGQVGRASPTWVMVLAMALAWTLSSHLSELGISSSPSRHSATIYELAFVFAVTACALGAWITARHAWLWESCSSSERALAETALLAACATLAVALTWLPATHDALPWAPAAALVAHVVAVSLLISRIPMPPGLRSILLVAALWWIPALIADRPGFPGFLGRFLSGPTHWLMDTASQTRSPAPADMASTVAFGLSGWLLTPRTPRP